MARGDGIDRTSARNARMTSAQIGNTQGHNEREKECYSNPDIVPERSYLNVHFKAPTADYQTMFDQMVAEKIISTRGLREGAYTFGELVFDVNSAYFYNNGGYQYAKDFYEEAYQAAVEIVGGEEYILSAVMHADERNRAMSDALGEDVFHYHLHVVYVPVVEKEILWSKRCKDPELVGTVKERVMQVSMSKKWASEQAVDEDGQPLCTKSGKPVLRKSYSVLQDTFYDHMTRAGYADIQRGERGSSEEHLTVTQFKVEREQARLAEVEQKLAAAKQAEVAMERIDSIEARPAMLSPSKVTIDREAYETLMDASTKYVAQERKESELQRLLAAATRMVEHLKGALAALREEFARYRELFNSREFNSLEQENDALRVKLERYEGVIEKHELGEYFVNEREHDSHQR